MCEYTLGFVKPHAYKHRREIRKMIERAGLSIAVEKDPYEFTKERSGVHYEEHMGKPFYSQIIDSVTNGYCALWIIGGEGAILRLSELSGETNPKDAAEGTIRRRFGESMTRNAFHRADSRRSVKREIYLHFDPEEIPENVKKVINAY